MDRGLPFNPFIEERSLVGDCRKQLTALAVPDAGSLKIWEQQNGIDMESNFVQNDNK